VGEIDDNGGEVRPAAAAAAAAVAAV